MPVLKLTCCMLHSYIPYPYAFIHQNETNHDFDQFHGHHEPVQRQDRHPGIMSQKEGGGDGGNPAETGVEQERDEGLASRADNKVGGVVERVDRQEERGDAYKS